MRPQYLIVHHSGGTDANPMADSSGYTVAQCNADHKARFNMLSSLGYYVGYQYVIEKDGKVTQCRRDDEEGAHTIGRNKDSIGIMLSGNFDVTMPTDPQIRALTELLKRKSTEYGIPLKNVVPHRQFANKSCFGRKLPDDWARLLIAVGDPNPLKKYTTQELINELMRRIRENELL